MHYRRYNMHAGWFGRSDGESGNHFRYRLVYYRILDWCRASYEIGFVKGDSGNRTPFGVL